MWPKAPGSTPTNFARIDGRGAGASGTEGSGTWSGSPGATPNTQGIEGYWGHLKPTLVARHRAVHPAYLPGYLAEADCKHNLPHGTDFIQEMLEQLLEPMACLPFK